MATEMVADHPVTLIIKAPTQKLPDQRISCERSWTILKLKEYIANIYPDQPRPSSQKLIYSGRLLLDDQKLDEILPQESDVHTLHLVCASKDPPITMPNPPMPPSSSPSPALRSRATTPSSQPPTLPQGYPQNLTAQQMAYMQQMYAQYMASYLQYVQTMGPGAAAGGVPQALPTQAPAAAGQPQQQQPQQGAGGGAAEEEEEEPVNRDWLDWFYIITRLVTLFLIIYFYSSPARFVLVLVTAILIYLYQIGFFGPPQPPQPQQPRHVPPPPPQQPAAPPPDPQQQQREEQQEIVAAMDGERPTPEVPPPPGPFETLWTFVLSFFSSLIPDYPAPINAN